MMGLSSLGCMVNRGLVRIGPRYGQWGSNCLGWLDFYARVADKGLTS
jgi:hypothetical protein